MASRSGSLKSDAMGAPVGVYFGATTQEQLDYGIKTRARCGLQRTALP